MYKMSIILMVEVIVLLQLLHTGSSRLDWRLAAGTEECFNEGETVTYRCKVPARNGVLDWNGIGFDCPSSDTITNNVLALPATPCPLQFGLVHTGICGPYFANLTCTEDQVDLISVLEFDSSYTMNGGNISCIFNTDGIKTFPVRVGVAPNPPSRVRVSTQQDKVCHFEWTPPNISVGGIGGYKIYYGENCDRCTPEAGFVNETEELTANCTKCIGEDTVGNMMCSFEVSTVSEDCWFDSPPVKATHDSQINSPMDITVTIACSLNPNPLIYVEWIYTFSEESRSAFSGFLITISDQSDHSVNDTLPDSTARSKYFNSTVLKEIGLVGDIWDVSVALVLNNENNFTYESLQLSVDDTIMSDPSSAVSPRQCIEVSINSHCDEKSDTFQAQIQFIEGTCESESELTNTTSKYTLQDYKTCVLIENLANTICYSAVLFHNELELNRTGRRELVLIPCTFEASISTMVKISSTNGDIPLGVELTVPHNTWLYFSCDNNCTLDQNQTRCTNGTFEPAETPILRDGCRCSDDSQYIINVYIGSILGVTLLLVLTNVIVVTVWKCYKNRKGSVTLAAPGQETVVRDIELTRSSDFVHSSVSGPGE